jgi:hypothetical protein
MSWSILEIGIDHSILIVHEFLKSCRAFQPEPPRSLERKINFLRKCVRRLPELATFQQAVLDLMNRVTKASELRHDIIHGFVTEDPRTATIEIKMSRIMPASIKADTPRLEKKFVLNPTQITERAQEVNILGAHALELAQALFDKFATK